MTTTEAGAGPALPMDPRIRQRRIAVRRDEGRRRLRLLIGGLAVASLVGGAVAATHSALLDVDHVRVRGGTHTSDAAVLAAAGLGRHTYMLDIDSGAIARRLEQLPWVERATVSRQWPSTVKIAVTERVPVAVIGAGADRVATVDKSGRVLALASQPPDGLLRLDGFPPAPEPGQELAPDGRAAVTVAAALPADVRKIVTSISDGDGDIQLHLGTPAAVVELGTADQLDAKIVALTTMLAKVDMRGARILDLRVPSAPVLTRQPNAR